MTHRVRVSPQAEADLAEVYVWYEEARVGLGSVFLESVEAALSKVAQFPELGRVVHGEVRRILMRRFPYGLTYVIEEDEIFVLGCFHLRRGPRVWRSRDA